jgi:hypothetical protein
MPALTLEVAEYKNAYNWYWRLLDSDEKFLADHEVKMNPGDFEYRGFLDLPSIAAGGHAATSCSFGAGSSESTRSHAGRFVRHRVAHWVRIFGW